MTDDGYRYVYTYDALGRLVTAKTRGLVANLVAEYKHNGLGFRTGWHYDSNGSGAADGSDPWFWFFYDERWRVAATYRGSDSSPKERFIYHNAGAAGMGGSSYIDSVILRDADDPEGFANAADGTLETRQYYLQNWRADVVAIIDSDGDPFEYIRYSAYGVPSVFAAGDINRDGVVNAYDTGDWDDFQDHGTGNAWVSADINRDGAINSADRTLIEEQEFWGLWGGDGRGVQGRLNNRKGYAGYEWDPAVSVNHVRHRVYVPEMGRWTKRDPLGYVDGKNLYDYGTASPVTHSDASGLSVGYGCWQRLTLDVEINGALSFENTCSGTRSNPDPNSGCALRYVDIVRDDLAALNLYMASCGFPSRNRFCPIGGALTKSTCEWTGIRPCVAEQFTRQDQPFDYPLTPGSERSCCRATTIAPVPVRIVMSFRVGDCRFEYLEPGPSTSPIYIAATDPR